MNWEDECYLLSKRKFRENANIVNVFTPNKGKIGGFFTIFFRRRNGGGQGDPDPLVI